MEVRLAASYMLMYQLLQAQEIRLQPREQPNIKLFNLKLLGAKLLIAKIIILQTKRVMEAKNKAIRDYRNISMLALQTRKTLKVISIQATLHRERNIISVKIQLKNVRWSIQMLIRRCTRLFQTSLNLAQLSSIPHKSIQKQLSRV